MKKKERKGWRCLNCNFRIMLQHGDSVGQVAQSCALYKNNNPGWKLFLYKLSKDVTCVQYPMHTRGLLFFMKSKECFLQSATVERGSGSEGNSLFEDLSAISSASQELELLKSLFRVCCSHCRWIFFLLFVFSKLWQSFIGCILLLLATMLQWWRFLSFDIRWVEAAAEWNADSDKVKRGCENRHDNLKGLELLIVHFRQARCCTEVAPWEAF